MWGENKDQNGYVVCGSVQSISNNIEQFNPEDFGYIIIDEAHHSSASTYKKRLSYFKPDFTLGLTATPERAEGKESI